MAKLPDEKVLLASELYHILGEVPGNTPICCEQTDGTHFARQYFTSVSLEKSDEDPEDTFYGHLPISGPVILLSGETMIKQQKEETDV